MLERALPYNTDAEQGVLGSILIDADAFEQVSDTLTAQDFYRDAHRIIYEAMTKLARRQVQTDFLTVCDELERMGKLEIVGGSEYITGLVNQVPTSGNLTYYADIVTRTACHRRLIQVAGHIAALGYEQKENAIEAAEKLLLAAALQQTGRDFSTAGQIVDDFLMDLDAIHRGERSHVGVSTGFRDVDFCLGGMQRSDLIILAARPGMGKSSYALSVAYHAAFRQELQVAMFSLEMSKQQLIQRLISFESHIDLFRLRNGNIHDAEWSDLVAARERLNSERLLIDDTGGITLAELRSKARRLKAHAGLDLLIVDYLQLMHADSDKRTQSREQEVAQISTGLKALAKELDVPVLALAQLSRAVESRQDKRPQLSDLRESGAIENDADVVQFIYRDEYYRSDTQSPGTAEIIIAKHRNGPTGTVKLAFKASETRFAELEEVLA